MSGRQRRAIHMVTLGVALAIGLGLVAAAQTPARRAVGQAASKANFFIETPAGWTLPRTAWGDPDLQGTWPISYVGSVPLERCSGGGRRGGTPPPPCDPLKAFWTDEEFKARTATAAGRADRYADAIKAGDFGSAFQAGIVDPTSQQRQTSLIVDPPNGRLPEMTAEGKRLSGLMRSSWALPDEEPVFESEQDFDTWDRCITRGMPASMFPFRYNNGVQIIQAPGYVVLNMEMIHEARIIPIGAPPPGSAAIKQWLGISRGRWEGPGGTTLVIETTNFKPGASMTNIGVAGSPEGNRFPTSERMRITERLTRLNDRMMLYEITTEDPLVLTRPWTARFPLKMDNSYKWWEYACIEGNRTIPDYISTSRAERAAAGNK